MSKASLATPSDAQGLRPRKKRAPSMAPADRRLHLIDAAVPLVSQHGGAVTTAQVAEAAGVAEGTIFRLFVDKDALLDAVLEHVLDAEPVLAAFALIPEDLPAETRVLRAAESMRLHFESALPVMNGATRHGQSARTSAAVREMYSILHQVAEGFFHAEVARGRLTGDPRTLGRLLVGTCQALVFQDSFRAGAEPTSTEAFTSVLLNGCLRSSDGSPG